MRRALACLAVVIALAGLGTVRSRAEDTAPQATPRETPQDQVQPDTSTKLDSSPAMPAAEAQKQSTPADTAHGASAAAAATAPAPPSFAETLCKELGWAAL